MKDAYYFPHDSNAKDDPKCVMVIEQLGLEGYGIYWVLIETLRDQPQYKYPLALIPAIARKFNTTAEKVKALVYNYGLFDVDGDDFFFSNSLRNRMLPLEARREKARKAGLASAQKRLLELNKSEINVQREFNDRSTNVQHEFNDRSTSKVEYSKVEDSKVKDSKTEINIAGKTKVLPYVHLFENEIEKLIDQEGQTVYNWCIEKLSAYKGQTGKRYKSDYSAILNWVIKAYYKEKTETNGKQISFTEAARQWSL